MGPHLVRQGLRRCHKCKQVLPVADFYDCKAKVSRAQYKCIACCARPKKRHTCGACADVFERTDRGGARVSSKVHLCDECEAALKWCARCGEVKPREGFALARSKPGGRLAHCKSCSSEKYRDLSDADRRERLLRKYSLSQAEWQALNDDQQGRCAICCVVPAAFGRNRRLFVDHCHASGRVRALLCGPCNVAIGNMKDDPARLRAAAAYLERFSE